MPLQAVAAAIARIHRRLYSGYCCVIGFLKTCFSVTPKPFSVFGTTKLMRLPTTRKAVTRALRVAIGSSTFQPKRISWS